MYGQEVVEGIGMPDSLQDMKQARVDRWAQKEEGPAQGWAQTSPPKEPSVTTALESIRSVLSLAEGNLETLRQRLALVLFNGPAQTNQVPTGPNEVGRCELATALWDVRARVSNLAEAIAIIYERTEV